MHDGDREIRSSKKVGHVNNESTWNHTNVSAVHSLQWKQIIDLLIFAEGIRFWFHKSSMNNQVHVFHAGTYVHESTYSHKNASKLSTLKNINGSWRSQYSYM